MARRTSLGNLLALLFLLTVLIAVWVAGSYAGLEVSTVMDAINQRREWGAVIYVLFLAASVFIAPLTSLPLLPFAAEVWGIVLGSLLSILGWWLGAMLAFLVTRRVGRPILGRFLNLETLDRWENRLPSDVTFWGIVLLRIILPVELPSFALAFVRTLSFRVCALATLVGITPFAFLWVSFGKALFTQDWVWVVLLGLLLLLSVYLAYRIRQTWLKRHANH